MLEIPAKFWKNHGKIREFDPGNPVGTLLCGQLHKTTSGSSKLLCKSKCIFNFKVIIINGLTVFQDDYRCCLKYGIIERDMAPVCPIDMSGQFTEEVTHFKGMHVKVGTLPLPPQKNK